MRIAVCSFHLHFCCEVAYLATLKSCVCVAMCVFTWPCLHESTLVQSTTCKGCRHGKVFALCDVLQGCGFYSMQATLHVALLMICWKFKQPLRIQHIASYILSNPNFCSDITEKQVLATQKSPHITLFAWLLTPTSVGTTKKHVDFMWRHYVQKVV